MIGYIKQGTSNNDSGSVDPPEGVGDIEHNQDKGKLSS